MFKTEDSNKGVELMVKLSNPPSQVVDLFRAAIPSTLRGQWDDETPHAAGRWIWNDLQDYPGFLFDKLGIATHLGLNPNGFEQVRSKFETARYRGAFVSDEKPRWWVNKIRGIFEDIIGKQVVGPFSSEREELLNRTGIEESKQDGLLAIAHTHEKKNPDCVAYEDDQRDENLRIQALFEDTEVDDRDANPPFGFEARRIFHGR